VILATESKTFSKPPCDLLLINRQISCTKNTATTQLRGAENLQVQFKIVNRFFDDFVAA